MAGDRETGKRDHKLSPSTRYIAAQSSQNDIPNHQSSNFDPICGVLAERILLDMATLNQMGEFFIEPRGGHLYSSTYAPKPSHALQTQSSTTKSTVFSADVFKIHTEANPVIAFVITVYFIDLAPCLALQLTSSN